MAGPNVSQFLSLLDLGGSLDKAPVSYLYSLEITGSMVEPWACISTCLCNPNPAGSGSMLGLCI